ncbi:hypothetical protein ANN_26097 [Periplaneta americana]|uniref:Partial AB-hydrolase lipase domain-containing protein n=1 Tax=Periplaneta americana TaxID=6978 RepID=A0ABQ8S5E4_PERAM|nr:hypothetical protein ANN_26097 [Periplaneta americana]
MAGLCEGGNELPGSLKASKPASAGLASLLAGGESEAFMTTPEVIRKYGYPAEEHTVETKDGYVLKHFRIPGGRTNSNAGRPAVILQHRLLMTSSAWIFLGQEGSLAFNLADAGYDVWLTNSRGNRYSRKHVTLSPDTEKFWDFSWHEMGMYDLPATVDYILNITGNKQLYYVGHSIGSSIFSVMTSKLPEYNQKISLNVGLAPAIYVGNPTGLELRTLVLFRNIMAVCSELDTESFNICVPLPLHFLTMKSTFNSKTLDVYILVTVD